MTSTRSELLSVSVLPGINRAAIQRKANLFFAMFHQPRAFIVLQSDTTSAVRYEALYFIPAQRRVKLPRVGSSRVSRP